VVLPYTKVDLDGGLVWDCAVRRLRDIDDAELRQGIATLPGGIEHMILARADPALIREQVLLLAGGKLALRLRSIIATFSAEEIAAEIALLAMTPDAEILDGGPRLAQEVHHLLEAGEAGDAELRPHILRLEAARRVLAQRREAGVSLGEEDSGAGMAFPGAADIGPERTLN
jgi:hypothetical protein